MDDLTARYADLNRAMVADRDVVIVGSALAGATKWVDGLRVLGARRCFALALTTGTGPLPDPDHVDSFVFDVRAPNPSAEVNALEQLLRDLPAPAAAALDRFDPDGSALVLFPPFTGGVDALGGRPAYGARPARFAALEDKTLNDELFDAAGITRCASTIVAPETASTTAAVWSGDARDGFNGGGDFVRWVREADDLGGARSFFAAHCDRVRIAPFLDGVPCSIHGFVCDDGVATFRPVEMLVFRRPPDHPTRDRFVYGGMATVWDPPGPGRDEMRAAARRMGEVLRSRVDYRGAFTIDGVMTVDGFRPTEMNPRYGGALSYAAVVAPALGLPVLQHRVVAGDGAAVRAGELEAVVVPASDARRWGTGHTLVTTEIGETFSVPVDGGTLHLGPATTGGLVRLEIDPEQVETGRSVAPVVAAAFARADAEFGTNIGPVVPATS